LTGLPIAPPNGICADHQKIGGAVSSPTLTGMNPKKEADDKPRREKENMDEPQEEFIEPSSTISHPKQEPSKEKGSPGNSP
jgi:hypothetical protein